MCLRVCMFAVCACVCSYSCGLLYVCVSFSNNYKWQLWDQQVFPSDKSWTCYWHMQSLWIDDLASLTDYDVVPFRPNRLLQTYCWFDGPVNQMIIWYIYLICLSGQTWHTLWHGRKLYITMNSAGTVTTKFMMTSSNGNVFCVTGPLCGEFTGHRWIPHTKAGDAEQWCFLWSVPE